MCKLTGTSIYRLTSAAFVAAALFAAGASAGPDAGDVGAPTEHHQGHDGHGSEHAGHDGHHEGTGDDHANHRAMLERKGYERSLRPYTPADVPLLREDGQATTLAAELAGGRPVIVNFIFTTCATICPVLSATFNQVQTILGPEAEGVRMVSISIDPEYDTPERLRDYARRFDAGPNWRFLTGTPGDIVAVQKSFSVYRGNKMNHEPTVLLRGVSGDTWVRLDGFASAADVAEEFRRLRETQAPSSKAQS